MATNKFVVGLTGGIGSGKSAAADAFAGLGIVVVDTDAIAHEITGPGGTAVPAVRAAFGENCIDAQGAMDRARVRALVFSDLAARRRLEQILHPVIRDLSDHRIGTASSAYVVHVVPLLIEAGDYRSRVHRVLVIDCPEALQIQRVQSRSGLTEDEVRRIMAAQTPRAMRVAAADDVILNDGSLDALRVQVGRLHTHYLKLADRIG